MSDKTIKLRWAGQGSIGSDNITPVSLVQQKKLAHGLSKDAIPEDSNLIIEGDNAPVMKSLIAGKFRLRGKIDFMLWDPPYNTGNTGAKGFIYEDNFYLAKEEQKRWAEDNKTLMFDVLAEPESAGISAGESERGNARWVKETDASKHSKWLSWMDVRLNLAKKLLKPTGVIAVHIGFQELFRLGLLMDEIFGEDNRLGIINWQCTGSTKNTKKGISSSTDYILVYARDKERAYLNDLPRSQKREEKYHTNDGDARKWTQGDLSTSQGTGVGYKFGIENPMTGVLHYPPAGRHWCWGQDDLIPVLNQWGVAYKKDKLGNCIVETKADRDAARKIFADGPLPQIYFSIKDGSGQPLLKRYRDEVKKEGWTPQTFWPFDEVLDDETEQEADPSIALSLDQSGTNRGGKKIVKDILGYEEVFDTVKPLKLTKRMVSLFCPNDGIVLDAFAGSGTSGHAVLEVNKEDNGNRRFVMIERGGNNNYADRITAERTRRVISGNWAAPQKETKALGGGFAYYKAGKPISAKYILESKRDDLVDIIMTSHVGSTPISMSDSYDIIGKTSAGNAIALVWNPASGEEHGTLTLERHKKIIADSIALGLTTRPVYIYGTVNAGPNGSKTYSFHQIPDEILAALGIQGLGE